MVIKFDKKEINKFINAERRERKAFKGRYAGELSKRERGFWLMS